MESNGSWLSGSRPAATWRWTLTLGVTSRLPLGSGPGRTGLQQHCTSWATKHCRAIVITKVVNPHALEIGSQLCIYCLSLEFTSLQKHVLRQSDRTGHIMVFTFYPSFCRTGIARHASIWGPRPRQHHRDLEIGRQLCIQDVAQEDEDIEPP